MSEPGEGGISLREETQGEAVQEARSLLEGHVSILATLGPPPCPLVAC